MGLNRSSAVPEQTRSRGTDPPAPPKAPGICSCQEWHSPTPRHHELLPGLPTGQELCWHPTFDPQSLGEIPAPSALEQATLCSLCYRGSVPCLESPSAAASGSQEFCCASTSLLKALGTSCARQLCQHISTAREIQEHQGAADRGKHQALPRAASVWGTGQRKPQWLKKRDPEPVTHPERDS